MTFVRNLGLFFLQLIWVLTPITSCAQEYPLKFKHISYQQGLSQSPILSIFQDKKGLIWIGNREGLLSYDGYEFRTYKHDEEDNSSISNDEVRAIIQDSNGKLWIGTPNGLNIFDPLTKKFKYIDVSKRKTVPAFLIDDKENFWVATYDGLKCLDINGIEKPLKFNKSDDLLKNGSAKCLLIDSRGLLWIGFSNGIKCVNPRTQKIENIYSEMNKNALLMNASISAIKEDKNGDLWITTEDKGFFWYSIKEKQLSNYRYLNNKSGLLSDMIKDILLFDDETVWFGTRMGLSTFNKKKLRFTNYVHNSSDFQSLSHNSIWSFLRDNAGNIWLGTYAGGLNICYPSLNNFGNIGEKIGENFGLSQPVVNSILAEKDGGLWIATDGGGLNYVDRKTEKSRFFELIDSKGQRNSHIVKNMAKLNNGKFYLGTLEGLGVFDVAKSTIEYLPIDLDIAAEKRRVNALVPDSNDIWAGMHTTGLTFINSKGVYKSFRHDDNDNTTISSNNVRSLALDGKKGIWVGTTRGLDYFSKKTHVFTTYNQFKKKTILAILKDSKNRLWIGTDLGLGFFNPKNNKAYFIKESDGLIGNTIESIIEDNSGKIWVSTTKGLSSLYLKKSNLAFDKSNVIINNYTSNDGLQSNQFLPGAVLKEENGELLFGGVNGITTLIPERIIKNTHKPQLIFTDFFIHNKLVTNTSEDTPLDLLIDDTKSITLKYDQNSISFKIAALNYVNPANNQYAYKLDGFDKEEDWHYVGNQRLINYTGLQPGNYIFKVKASNNDNVWNPVYKSIKIKILPPFWKAWWAYLIYLVIFCGLLYLFRTYSIKAERLKYELELESMSHIKDEELSQRKMNFFANISHEIKTPLTMITAPIEQLLNISDGNDKAVKHLKLMHSNGERLKKLVDQLLAFRKFDSHQDGLMSTENDILNFIEEISLAFTDLLESKEIRFSIKSELTELNVWFDKDKIEKVLFNLLSNAIKFTPNKGTINIKVSVKVLSDKKHVHIEVIDNGCGITKDRIDTIFEQFKFFNTNNLNKEGTGLGLSFSKSLIEMHYGKLSVESRSESETLEGLTVFNVFLPLGKEHLAPQEISRAFLDEENLMDYRKLGVKANTEQLLQIKSHVLAGIKQEKPTILIVEDNADLLNFIVQNFEDEFEILAATNGELGAQKAFNDMPDIIISDVMMPVKDGINLCRELKLDIRTSHIPIILLTARATSAFKVEGFETGADDYVTKPFTVSVLITRVWNLLYSRQKLRDKFHQEVRLQPQNIMITSADDKFLHTLMNYIENNISNPSLTVEELCKDVALGRGTLYKKIKALTGQTVNDFVRSIRLKRASQLLRNEKHNINEVAYLVGFSDVNHFRKCFKEQFGLTPKEYSKNNIV